MTRNTAIALGVGATIVLVGGGLALAGGGKKGTKGSAAKPGKMPFAPAPKATGKPVKPSPGRGFSVILGCQFKVNDLALALATAYKVGRSAASLTAAQQKLWDFGECGVSAPLKPAKDSLRSLFLVEYELYRGLLEPGTRGAPAIDRVTGETLLRNRLMEIAIAGVSTAGLDGRLP